MKIIKGIVIIIGIIFFLFILSVVFNNRNKGNDSSNNYNTRELDLTVEELVRATKNVLNATEIKKALSAINYTVGYNSEAGAQALNTLLASKGLSAQFVTYYYNNSLEISEVDVQGSVQTKETDIRQNLDDYEVGNDLSNENLNFF